MNYAALVFSSVAVIVQHLSRQYIEEDRVEFFSKLRSSDSLPIIENYDFIIVGGGTAGCVLASRLSENANFTVLLLEIGGTSPSDISVPAFMGYFSPLEEIAFQYQSIPQNRTGTVFKDGRYLVRAGKNLGGTSNINAMFYNRGHPQDYNRWAEVTGDDSWKYENVLQYFKKIENYQGQYAHTDQHSSTGPLTISSQKYAPGLHLWLCAGIELRLNQCDPNGPQQPSMGPIEYTKNNGRRVSSYDAYLKPLKKSRPNLQIEKYAHVTKIILDGAKNAVGVMYTKHGVSKMVKASKEIILCAGVYGSASILLKSGIGSRNDLQKLGITLQHDLPVGKNLKEHPLVPLRIILNDTRYVYNAQRDITPDAVENFKVNGDGPLTLDKSLMAQGFDVSNVSIQEGQPHWPDIQYSLYSQDFPHLKVPKSEEEKTKPAIFILPYLSRPRSTGFVSLNPKNISGDPLIDFNFLSEPHDLQVYIDGVRKSLNIFENTSAYASVGAHYSTIPDIDCVSYPFRSDDYWVCYIKKFMFPGNHGSGSCKMGRIADVGTVVDSKLRVKGVTGLRVADASIMPTITNSNTQAAVYMIAEKVSDDIKKEWEIKP